MKNKKDLNLKRIKKNVKGITLIALVVTVIVLLILAGVAINLTVGDNGLFRRAQNAVDTYDEASKREAIELAVAGMQIGSTQGANMTKQELENSLKDQFGDEASVEDNEDGSFLVTIGENQYYVGEDGEIIDSSNMVKISTAEELKAFRDDVNSGNTYEGKYVYLTDDITLESTEEWEPIGYYDQETEDVKYPDTKDNKAFKGIFDGKNNEINGITITSSDEMCHGLFGLVINGTINNVVIGENNNISGRVKTAGVVGYLYGFEGNINNCVNYANISGGDTTGGIVGSIVGQHTIYNCKNYGDIVGIGGIVGGSNGTNYPQEFDNYSHKIINCENFGTIKSIGLNYAGGMVEYLKGNILNCCNKGTITGEERAGGIVGSVDGSVENCYNIGDVNGDRVGGILNENSGSKIGGIAINCYSIGTVTGRNAGNIISSEDIKKDKIINCYTRDDNFTAENLSDLFKDDVENINGGYPILYWE